MKKKLFTYLLALLGMMAFVACTDEEGTEPGGDSQPSVLLYQYVVTSADGDYDPDTDTHVRLAVNNKVAAVYYLVEATETCEAYIASNGEEAYKQYVVDNGTQATVTDGIVDLFLTGLRGAVTISAVGVGTNNVLAMSQDTFFGYTWTAVATGSVYAALLDGTTNYSWASGFTLQQRDDNPDVYRILNLYGDGYNLVINAQGDWQTEASDYFGHEGVAYKNITFETLGTPYSYGSYGRISLSDFTTYSGDTSNLYDSRVYEDYHLYSYSIYTVSAGYITMDYFQFIPD